MKLDKLFSGLKRIDNGDYVLEGDLICDDTLEINLDDRLVVSGKIEAKKSIVANVSLIAGWGIKAGWGIEAGCGIKAGEGIEAGCGIDAGDGIEAGTFLHSEKRIFAGISVYYTSCDCNKNIVCAELRKGEICYGNLLIRELKDDGSKESK